MVLSWSVRRGSGVKTFLFLHGDCKFFPAKTEPKRNHLGFRETLLILSSSSSVVLEPKIDRKTSLLARCLTGESQESTAIKEGMTRYLF